MKSHFLVFGLLCALCVFVVNPVFADPLPNTQPLEDKDDLATKMVAGIDKYLMREIDSAVKGGADRWNVKTDSLPAYLASVNPNRERLRKLLGAVDERIQPVKMEYVGGDTPSAVVAESAGFKVYAVRWPVLPGVDGEGLLLEPNGRVLASVVAIPDADQTPEQLVGLAPGVPDGSQFARRLASTCRVIVPVLIDRKPTSSPSPVLKRDTNIPHREFIWRMAYEMGRHPIGYEVQKVLAAVDWLKSREKPGEIGVFGYGEGGLVALYAGAIDPRIASTVVSGVGYGSRGQVWREPIDRSVWAALPEFRDEHLHKLFGGRGLIYEHSHSPKFELLNPPGYRKQAAAGLLTTPEDVRREISEADSSGRTGLAGGGDLDKPVKFEWRTMALPGGQFGHAAVVTRMLLDLNVDADPPPPEPGRDRRANFVAGARQMRQFQQLVDYTQRLWRVSDDARKKFFAKADSSSPAAWEKSSETYRKHFWEEVIGKLPAASVPPNPRTRALYDTPKWTGHEVVLDVHPDVFAYGIVLLPKNVKPGEKRPVVVCQHGLEGRPTDVCNPKERTKYYNSFGAQLADLGYIVFAPQNPYIGWEKFRILQRKAHPLKLSLFAFIVRQHEVTLDWLSTLPNVDGDRIGFYGLSYGGKTAMRVPAILPKYKLSICSADFNEWVGKNVSVDFSGSYMYTIEYDMYEYDLGHTFNYAEMAYLIAPRPFMVERGHDDGVGIDEMVAYEYAKIRYLYQNKLKIPDNTAIEWFAGGHEINGKGTFAFLKTHLGWPK